MLPIWILMSWLLGTVALLDFGPYEYHIPNRFELYVYLAAVHIALYLGYLRGNRVRGRAYLGPWSGIKIAKVSLAITTVLLIAELILTRGGDVGRIALAMRDPHAAYLAGSTKGGINIFNYISIFSAPIKVLGITLGVFYWSSLKGIQQIALVFILGVIILGNIGGSVRAGIIFTLFYFATSFAAAYFGGRIQFRRRTKLLLVIAAMFLIVSFFQYVAYLTENRNPGLDPFLNPLSLEYPVEGNILYKVFPEKWHATATITSFYVSHGYVRLARALDMPFDGIGFGIGNSPFLMRNFERITGLNNVKELSYGMRLDPDADLQHIGTYWSTMYTWIASDVTFFGSIGIVFFIGYFLALAWIDALRWHNPAAISAFSCLAFIVFAFPRTNPLQDGSGITVYLGLTFLWWLTRKSHFAKRHHAY
jgi:hypothetical protein